MGKYLFEYIIPAALLTSFAVWGVRTWYLKRFGKHVRNANQVNRASEKYQRQLKPVAKPKPDPAPAPTPKPGAFKRTNLNACPKKRSK